MASTSTNLSQHLSHVFVTDLALPSGQIELHLGVTGIRGAHALHAAHEKVTYNVWRPDLISMHKATYRSTLLHWLCRSS